MVAVTVWTEAMLASCQIYIFGFSKQVGSFWSA